MDIKRNVRLFFVSYGKLLFELLFVIALIILGLQYLNKKVAEPKQVSAQINIENTNNVQNIQQDKNIISTFLEYCKNNQVQEAYAMLSENCKKEKYNSIDLFNKNYMQKYFHIDIEEYKVYILNKNYVAEIKESAISSGKVDSIEKLEFSIESEVLENKIYIYD